MQWIEQAARVLKPTGTLFVCGFSEILADLKHPATKFFKSCRWIIWHYKNKAKDKSNFADLKAYITFCMEDIWKFL
jgi:DNA modification methylase